MQYKREYVNSQTYVIFCSETLRFCQKASLLPLASDSLMITEAPRLSELPIAFKRSISTPSEYMKIICP